VRGKERAAIPRTSVTAPNDEFRTDKEEEGVQRDQGNEAEAQGREEKTSVVEPGITNLGQRPQLVRHRSYALPRNKTPVPMNALSSCWTAKVT
jgi:hypothetical protein